MSFLFPLYFLGAAALAVPLLLHLRKRPPKDQTTFSSLMFLAKSPEKLTRRSKLEKWLLLALRCLALLLLVLVFARPFFQSRTLATANAQGKRLALLIDNSASMQRGDLWQQSLARAEEELRSLEPTDEAAVIVFDEQNRVIIAYEAWRGLPPSERLASTMAELGRVVPTWRATDLGGALTNTIELMMDREAMDAASGSQFAKKEVVLISDFQEGSQRDSLNRLAWPEDVALRPVVVETKGGTNFSLHATGGKTEEGKKADRPDRGVRVRVASSQGGQVGKFTLAWVDEGGLAEEKVAGSLPPGGVQVLMAPPRSDELAGGVLEIQGDDHSFDNRVYVAPTQPRPVKILYIGEDATAVDAGSPLYYLSRALRKNTAVEPALESRQAGEVKTAAELRAFDVVVLTGGWDSGLAGKVAEFVREAGGMVVCSVAAGTGNNELEILTGLQAVGVSEAEVDGYAMLAGVDFKNPVMEPFAEAQVRDFSKIHFWKHRVVDLNNPAKEGGKVSILANFDDGSPAWLKVSQGKGQVYLMMSGWEPTESQLALSSKFVPLVFSILAEAGFSAVKPPPIYVGGAIPVGNAKWVKRPGDAEPVELEEGQRIFSATSQPGFYTVLGENKDGVQRSRTYAVNLKPAESRVDAFDPRTLADFGIGLDQAAEEVTEAGAIGAGQQRYRLELGEKEGRQKAWKWLVLGLLGVLWLETWVAGAGFKSERSGVVK